MVAKLFGGYALPADLRPTGRQCAENLRRMDDDIKLHPVDLAPVGSPMEAFDDVAFESGRLVRKSWWRLRRHQCRDHPGQIRLHPCLFRRRNRYQPDTMLGSAQT